MATFTDMAGIRLGLGPAGDQARDLTQARQAIEALRALLEVADRELGPAQARPFREPLAALQMAYARAVERPAGRGPAAARRPRRRAAAAPASAAPRGRPGEPPLGAAGDPQAGRPAGLTWPSGRERRPVPCGRNRRRIGLPSGCRSLARSGALSRSGRATARSDPDLGGSTWPTSCRTTQRGWPSCSAWSPSRTASDSPSTCCASRRATSGCARSRRPSRRAPRRT